MHLAVAILAGLYFLPDGAAIEPPDPAQAERIERALETLRRAESEEGGDRAVRELALVGEPALPAVVKRLNEAGAGERLLLLAAVRRMPRAAPLLEQAGGDPHPAVRAWVAVPERRPEEEDLRRLARAYADILALAEEKRSEELEDDLRKGGIEVARPGTLETMRRVMRDRRYADSVQNARDAAATRFARAGGEALANGELALDLEDRVFLTYLALLREEDSPFQYAVAALMAKGADAAPVLEEVLRRGQHDPRKILRLIAAVDAGRARRLCEGFEPFDGDTQRAMMHLAPRLLDGEALVALYERGALAKDGSVRIAALDGLLDLEAPAGAAVAPKLLDAAKYRVEEFRRAAGLLARAGELDLLIDYATIAVPNDGKETSEALRKLRTYCRKALAGAPKPVPDGVVEKLLVDDPAVALGLVRNDAGRLRALLGRSPGLDLPILKDLVTLHGRGGLDAALAWIRERGLAVPYDVVKAAGRERDVALLIELARPADPETMRFAFGELADLPAIDPAFEKAMLALLREAPAKQKDLALAALIPLATPAVRDEFLKAGKEALSVLAARSESGGALPFAVPMIRWLPGADTMLLRKIGLVALAAPDVEPGLVLALLDAWETHMPSDEEQGAGDVEALEERGRLVRGLARSSDAASARLLFERVLRGEVRDHTILLGIFRAAVQHVAPEELAKLVPLLRSAAEAEYPNADRSPPPPDAHRFRLLVGGLRALAASRSEAGLELLCDLALDPSLQPAAFDWKRYSRIPGEAIDCMRAYPAAAVAAAFGARLRRAEEEGRLAKLEPPFLYAQLNRARYGWERGRRLPEVEIALCDVLERLPFEGDVPVRKMLALVGLRRYAEAAEAARAEATRLRRLGVTARDDFWTPERLEGRALLCDALAKGTVDAFREVLPEVRGDSHLCYLAAWYLVFYVPDLALAEEAALSAVRLTGFLDHTCRDVLAAVRNAQGRPDEALRLIDPLNRLPVKRSEGNGFQYLFEAKAHLLEGDPTGAGFALEKALRTNRRTLGYARLDPAFAALEDVIRLSEEEFLDELFTLD